MITTMKRSKALIFLCHRWITRLTICQSTRCNIPEEFNLLSTSVDNQECDINRSRCNPAVSMLRSKGSSLAVYSGGSRYEYGLGDRLFLLKFLVIFPISSQKKWRKISGYFELYYEYLFALFSSRYSINFLPFDSIV